ncbi:DUF6155 family protein [Saccharicrinis sp. 156]|uniref:DUF6155 family protein n=1 Tax=Saccharicrinis sp. 156 TaxID=3417574 RepID=UPI003D350C35
MPTKGLKKHLSTSTKEELIKHIVELDKKYPSVQEYHLLYLNNDVEAVVAKYKKQIENEFYPSRGEPKMRLSVARKAVSEVKKLGIPAESLADLMLFYVEAGVQFTNDYGDINEPFYNSMASMFGKVLGLMQTEGILEHFQDRAYKITEDACDTGWGFHETLCDFYYAYYQI